MRDNSTKWGMGRSLLVLTMASALAWGTSTASGLRDSRLDHRVCSAEYREGSKVRLRMRGTERLPDAMGKAVVQRSKGRTRLEVKLEDIKPATLFGGDLSTYVLWLASPEGHLDNVGEFVVKDRKSKLKATTPLQSFGLLVTAEPHFLVERPSTFVVARSSAILKGKGGPPAAARVKSWQDGYQVKRESLQDMPYSRGEIRTDLGQAESAIRLALRSGAEEHAADLLAEARAALERAETILEVSEGNRKKAAPPAREAVRLAALARTRSKQRIQQLAAADERRRNQEALAERQRALEEERRARELERREREEERRRLQAALEGAVGELAEVRETAQGLIVRLPHVLFAIDKSRLKPESREVLSRLTGILQIVDGFRLHIEGHTDSSGEEDYNRKLSEKRAEAVQQYLVDHGLSSDITQAVGFGESRPIADNATRKGRSLNRRVELRIEELEGFGNRHLSAVETADGGK